MSSRTRNHTSGLKARGAGRQLAPGFSGAARALCLTLGIGASLIAILAGASARAEIRGSAKSEGTIRGPAESQGAIRAAARTRPAIYSGRVTVSGSGTAVYHWTDTEGGSGCRVSGVDYVHWAVRRITARYAPQVDPANPASFLGLAGSYLPQIVLSDVPVTTHSQAAGREGTAPNCGLLLAGKLQIHSFYPTMIIDLARPAAVIPLDAPVSQRFVHTFLDPLLRSHLPGATGPEDDYFLAMPMAGPPHFVATPGLVLTLRGRSGSYCEKLPILGGSSRRGCRSPVSIWHADQGFVLTLRFH